MQGGSDCSLLAKLVVGFTSLLGGLGDQLDASPVERLADLIRYVHAAVGSLTNKEKIRTSGEHFFEIVDEQRMPLFAPPTLNNPIGQEIKMDGYKLKVIGVLEKQGDIFGSSLDNFAIIPITTFNSFYGDRRRSISISVMAASRESYADMMMKAEGHMRTIRKVPPGEENDFEIVSNETILSQINDITFGIRTGAFVIAAIALLAAGVGIMNIMLVSVTERTKEIGIRKSIGAKKKNVLIQFLIEAITLCLFGGFIGIVLGVLTGNFVGSFLEAKATIPLDWVGIGVFICILIGVTFGTYPAYKAANLDPIEALRYE